MPLIGHRGHVGIRVEAAWGTYGAAASHYFPALTATPGINEAQLEDRGIRGAKQRWGGLPGLDTVAGSITANCYADTAGLFLSHAMDATVSTSGAGPYTHTITPEDAQNAANNELRPFSLEVDVDDATNYRRMVGCQLNTLSFSVTAPGLTTMSADVIGLSETKEAVVTPTWTDQPAFKWHHWQIETGAADIDSAGTIVGAYEGFTVTFANNLIARPALNQLTTPRQIASNDFQGAQLQATLQFDNYDQYDDWVAATEQSLRIHGTQTVGGDTHFITFFFPKTRFVSGNPPINGPGPITVGVAADIMYNRSDTSGFLVKVQNALATM